MINNTTLTSTAVMPGLSGAATMANSETLDSVDRARQRRAEAREFKVTVGFLFAVFLPIALASRLLPRTWRPLGKLSVARQSPIGEARSAANVIAPFMLSR